MKFVSWIVHLLANLSLFWLLCRTCYLFVEWIWKNHEDKIIENKHDMHEVHIDKSLLVQNDQKLDFRRRTMDPNKIVTHEFRGGGFTICGHVVTSPILCKSESTHGHPSQPHPVAAWERWDCPKKAYTEPTLGNSIFINLWPINPNPYL